jgi:hypothetical protein
MHRRTTVVASIVLVTTSIALAMSRPPEQDSTSGARHGVRSQVIVDVPHLSLEQYVTISSNVVVGRVLEQRAIETVGELPYTCIVFEVIDDLLGSAPGTIEVRVGGIEGREQELLVTGAPRFAVGEAALLFLQFYPEEGFYGIVGLQQGTYRLRDFDPVDYGNAVGLHAVAGTPAVDLVSRILDVRDELRRSGKR